MFTRLFDERVCLLAGARTIEQTAVAVSSPQGAGIWMTAEGHQRWGEVLAQTGTYCTTVLDSGKTRVKRFQDRIDYRTLFQEPRRGTNEQILVRGVHADPEYK
ncbi:MAG: hypothetical protein PHI97_24095 [Desulfobulbus sp.]|nr:hypothetical protein [Desulfobulbus sp.]